MIPSLKYKNTDKILIEKPFTSHYGFNIDIQGENIKICQNCEIIDY